MIQDIYPSKLDNSYKHIAPDDICDNDYLLGFNNEGGILTKIEDGKVIFTRISEISPLARYYLFSIDEQRYFFVILDKEDSLPDGFEFRTVRELRDQCSGNELFAAFTAYHIWKWVSDNRYCGKCGKTFYPDKNERALRCDCGNVVYPRINPAVIVGVIKDDTILITRYRKGFAHNALVAGFTEIGETLEQTVEREVMEETGVKVKNIRYYKSQPWGMAQDILVGFFCEADGDGLIHMDRNELKYAEWVRREDIVLQPYNHSLTNEMMSVFKNNEI